MISARGLRSGDGTGSAHLWVSIIWMASVLNFSAVQTTELTAKPRVARCGENVTMTCDANVSDPGRIKLFQWIAKDTTCEHGKNNAGAKIVCQSEEKRLSLTVLNVMPGDQGEFLCKLHSETGTKYTKTLLVTPSCYGIPILQVNESQAYCCYTKVYPRSPIQWFQEGVNLTDFAVQLPDVEEKDGRYNICSTFPAEKMNLNQSVNCSLGSGSHFFSITNRYKPKEANVLGAAVSLSASLTVVLIMAATATKGIFQRLMME